MIEKTLESIQLNLEEQNKKMKDMTAKEIILWGYKILIITLLLQQALGYNHQLFYIWCINTHYKKKLRFFG